MPKFEVCLSPDLIHLYDLKGKNAIIVDILRATSCMVTAMAHGIAEIIPVATIGECKALQNNGLPAAAERDGSKVEGFDLDNSPFSYMAENLKNKTIAVTTTNGTQALVKSLSAETVLVGAFLNIGAVSEFIIDSNRDTVVVCAGWKGNFNLEDTLFAGALAEKVQNYFDIGQDSAIAALNMFESNKNDLLAFVNKSQHVKRLANLHIHKDIAFCLTFDLYNSLPIYKTDKLINFTK